MITLAEFKTELDRDIQLPSRQYMKAVFEKVKRNDFPELNRMRRKLILESLALVGITVLTAVVTMKFSGSVLMTVYVSVFSALFIAAEILGFRYYWHTPYAMNMKESLEVTHNRFRRIASVMKTLKLVMALTVIGVMFIDGYLTALEAIPFIGDHIKFFHLPWPVVLMMFIVNLMVALFSFKWTKREKQVKKLLVQFED